MAQIAIVMGSASDLPVMRKALELLDDFGISYEVAVASAHRTPDKVAELARSAADRGIAIIIAGAGMAAALPGVLAAHTLLPVIGVPLSGSALGGTDALYSMVQMPSGVPVATVGIDAAANAALVAVRILALNDTALAEKLTEYRRQMAAKVEQSSQQLQQ